MFRVAVPDNEPMSSEVLERVSPVRLRRRLPWPSLLMTLAVLMAIFTLSISDDSHFVFLGSFSSLIATVATTIAAVKLPKHRLSWALIALAMGVNTIGDGIYEAITRLNGAVPVLSLADVFYLLTYPLLFAGLGLMVARVSRERWRDVCTDASAVATIAGLAIWQFFVINPGVLDEGSMRQRVVFASYAMADVLIVAAMVGLLFLPHRRNRVLALLVGFAVMFLASDVFYNIVSLDPFNRSLRISDALYILAYGILSSAAALSIRRQNTMPDEPAPIRELRIPYARIGLLGAALIGAPTMAVVVPALGFDYHAWVYVCAALFVGTLVLARLVSLLRNLSREQRRSREAETKLAFQATHDDLTGLPNRTFLLESLSTALASPDSERLAVMFVDLDNFKFVNDSLGHQAGDVLLRSAAQRIQSAVRNGTLVARIGGDEFVIVSTDVRAAHEAEEVAARVIAEFRMPFTIGDDTMFTSPSIGIVLKTDQADPASLLRDADIALFQAKASGRCCARLFDTTMREWVTERTQIEAGIRHALEHGELAVAYQPRIDLATGEIDSFEALLRWPSQPTIPTIRVIEIAEATGLIDEIGSFVLDRAFADMRHHFGPASPDVRIAINVSMRQLAQPDFTRDVANALARHRVEPHRVSLELTETFLSEEPELAKSTLHNLRALGVKIEIDDFGVGYSSLARLADYPIDGVKIDRGFITALVNDDIAEAMVVAIVALSTAMALTVTAEGVETSAQAEAVRRLGCHLGQGFLFAAALTRDDAVATIAPRSTTVNIDDWPTWANRTATPATPSRNTPRGR